MDFWWSEGPRKQTCTHLIWSLRILLNWNSSTYFEFQTTRNKLALGVKSRNVTVLGVDMMYDWRKTYTCHYLKYWLTHKQSRLFDTASICSIVVKLWRISSRTRNNDHATDLAYHTHTCRSISQYRYYAIMNRCESCCIIISTFSVVTAKVKNFAKSKESNEQCT